MKILFITSLLFSLHMMVHAQLKTVAYTDGTQKLNGVFSAPYKAKAGKPGVLILPAWKGIDAPSRSYATALSDSGYYAFIADIYGEGNYPADNQEAGAQSSFYKTHTDNYQKRIQLALEQLIAAGADRGKIVVIGYCFGGFGAIEAARINLPIQGIVSFHGSYGRDTTKAINIIKPKMLILHGNDDPYTSEAQISEFKNELMQAKADWQMNFYANAVHAFTDFTAGTDNSKGAAYNEIAAKRSWNAMLLFLEECFK